jgi:glycerol-3-phosphate dehydrogenase (NAD(P)+)
MQSTTVVPASVCVVGVGSVGFALLDHLDRHRHDSCRLTAFDTDRQLVDCLRQKRRHLSAHDGRTLGEDVRVACEPSAARGCAVVVLAVESEATRDALQTLQPWLVEPVRLLSTVRALDWETGQRLSLVAREVLGDKLRSYAQLAGGVTAQDLLRDDPLRLVLAGDCGEDLEWLRDLLGSSALRLEISDDLAGAEYAAALGNALGVLAGILQGAGVSSGCQAGLVARAAREVEALAVGLGAKPATFAAGSACWGSEVYAAASAPAPGRELGGLLGRGFAVDDALAAMSAGHANLEGFRTIKALGRLRGLDRHPILSALFDFVVGAATLDDLLADLHGRP